MLIKLFFIPICFIAVFIVSAVVDTRFSFPYPPFNTLPQNETYLIDMGGIMLGIRRIAADIAWVQLVQYYARPEMTKKEKLEIEYHEYIKYSHENDHEHEHGEESECPHCSGSYHPDFREKKPYSRLYEKTLRVVQLDPFFHYAYLYTSGALAWNHDDYDTAYELLRLGIQNDPSHWRFGEYLGAIVYKEKGDVQRMLESLETVVAYEGCPNLIKAALAGYHENQKQFHKSLKIWIEIYDSGDKAYTNKALTKIQEFESILKS